jgi:hypothetical protein
MSRAHIIENRKIEIILGLIAVIVGCLFLRDAFDKRNKKLPWPASGLAPW